MNKEFTLSTISNIKNSIQQIDDVTDEERFKHLLFNTELFSLTQPIFFDELFKIFQILQKNQIEGDIIEAGVWSGATAIYIHALNKYFKLNKKLYLFDSFSLNIDHNYKLEKDKLAAKKFLSWEQVKVPTIEDVKCNFRKFNLLDSKIKFIQGDVFKTSNQFTESSISLLRIDLDFYEPTYFMLQKFYDKVTEGGYIIIDDYGVEIFNCKDAVDKFRVENNISSKLIRVGDFVAYWKKENS